MTVLEMVVDGARRPGYRSQATELWHSAPLPDHRKRHDRQIDTTGKYASHQGTVESNVYQRTVDYPDEWIALFLVTFTKKMMRE